ncbi:MAG: FKBP-type peptidyl-prolyl cis-trans isomerase [candidate division Zixibacteria bacterium]|nr:FKBP-type peptidyl-prolyl cis-trans isomerase [candidate division Zixibacteria bacterium]
MVSKILIACVGLSLAALTLNAATDDTTKTPEKPAEEQMGKKADSVKADTSSVDSSSAVEKRSKGMKAEKKKQGAPKMVTNPSGVSYMDMKVGDGKACGTGDKVVAHYTLWPDIEGKKGKLIQSSKEGAPYPCQIGYLLISGWSEGMQGMKPGGIREVHIPSKHAYGPAGMGEAIPPNTNLIFEIELVRYQ